MENVSRHAHFVFTKDAPSEHYTCVFQPHLYFFSKDNLPSPEKRLRLSAHPHFRHAIFIPYTLGISTTDILEKRLECQTNSGAADAPAPTPASRTIS